MRPALLILAKDMRLRLRDRSAIVLAVVAPLSLAFILNTVMDISEDFTVEYGIVDEDGGEVAAGFVDALESIDALDMELTSGLSRQQALESIDQDDLDAAFVLPAGLTDAVSAGPAMSEIEPPGGGGPDSLEVTVIGNLDSTLGTQVATSIAEDFGHRLDAARLSVAAVLQNGEVEGGSDELDELIEEASGSPPAVQVAELEATSRQLDSTTYLTAGMAVLFLFFTVTFGVMGMFEERIQGTLPRLLVAPLPRGSVLAAKVLGSVVLGVAAMAIMVVASTVLMGADWGDPLAVAVLSVAAVLAAVSIIGVVAAVARTVEQATAVQSIIAMALAVLGGSFFPVGEGDAWLAQLRVVTPHHWFLQGLGDGLVGGLGAAWPAVGALLAFAAVFGAVGAVTVVRKASGALAGGLS